MKECKHCLVFFEPRRKNHLYCCSSCKTLASYKRNRYQYVSGHYKKNRDNKLSEQLVATPVLPQNDIANSEEKLDKLLAGGVTGGGITNAALGNVASDGAVTILKNMFAPHLLNANKGDVEILTVLLNEIKTILVVNNSQKSGFSDFYNSDFKKVVSG